MHKNKKNIEKELKEIAPILLGLKKDIENDVPDAYFKNLPDKIIEKVKLQGLGINGKKSHSVLRALYSPLGLSIAATLLVLMAVVSIMNIQRTAGNSQSLGSDYDELFIYVMEQVEFMNEDDFLLLHADMAQDNGGSLFLDEESINIYLEENIDKIDINTLEELL